MHGFKSRICGVSNGIFFVEIADWIKKLYANPLDSDRLVSNPVFVMILIGCMVEWLALWILNPAIGV